MGRYKHSFKSVEKGGQEQGGPSGFESQQIHMTIFALFSGGPEDGNWHEIPEMPIGAIYMVPRSREESLEELMTYHDCPALIDIKPYILHRYRLIGRYTYGPPVYLMGYKGVE